MVSIIIVNYKVKQELFRCIQSIYDGNKRIPIEIIVVDNDERKKLHKEISERFPKVIYVPNKNKGFGEGCNRGVEKASGEFLFFLNPDTVVDKNTIYNLVKFLKEHNKIDVVAPHLYDSSKNIVPLQGAKILSPLYAIFSFSFISRVLPFNRIKKSYWLEDLASNNKNFIELQSVPGTAFVIRKKIFQKIGGFDEKFFLYFEEHDLCKRLVDSGYILAMLKNAKVYHLGGQSTKQINKINKIFMQSRFYYFRKHYGILAALITEGVMRINKFTIFLISTLILSFIFRVYKIDETMTFIGDQGWFYLSARDLILGNSFPLVGIESSRVWLHQGPLWTYLLAPILPIFSFNPLSGAILSASLDTISIFVHYKLGALISKRVAVFTTLLYCISPLLIENARTPYHTSPIPLMVGIFLYALIKWVQNKKNIYFFLSLFMLAVLYNLELATVIFIIAFLLFILIGYIAKQEWARKILNFRVLLLGAIAFLIPMIPVLLYDVQHDFSQTIKFGLWIGYKILQSLQIIESENSVVSFQFFIEYLLIMNSRLLFALNSFIAAALLLAGLLYGGINLLKNFFSKQSIIFLFTIFPLLGIIATKTPSFAYLPMVASGCIILVALLFDRFYKYATLKHIALIVVCIVVIGNVFYLVSNDFSIFPKETNLTLDKRIAATKQILDFANKESYSLTIKLPGGNFPSSTMNYEYLAWWLERNPPSKHGKSQISIIEKNENIIVEKIN